MDFPFLSPAWCPSPPGRPGFCFPTGRGEDGPGKRCEGHDALITRWTGLQSTTYSVRKSASSRPLLPLLHHPFTSTTYLEYAVAGRAATSVMTSAKASFPCPVCCMRNGASRGLGTPRRTYELRRTTYGVQHHGARPLHGFTALLLGTPYEYCFTARPRTQGQPSFPSTCRAVLQQASQHLANPTG